MSSCRNELFFLQFLIEDLAGPNLPSNGDVLRYYFHRRHSQSSESSRTAARATVDKCIKIWKDKGIPTTQPYNGVKYLLKMLSDFEAMQSNYSSSSAVDRRRVLAIWRQKCELLFSIAKRNSVQKCDKNSREILLAAKKKGQEFRMALKKGELSEATTESSKSRMVSAKEGKKSGQKSLKKSKVVKNVAMKEMGIKERPTEIFKAIEYGEQHPSSMTFPNCFDKDEDEEDIIPPMVQKTIIKEEIDIDWDPADEWSTYLVHGDGFAMADKENYNSFHHTDHRSTREKF